MRQLKIATQITNRDSQAVEKYLQEISKIPMITPEEETILAQKIKMGDQRALERLTTANLTFRGFRSKAISTPGFIFK
jgi:RNA polymerase primary sigma factor